VIVGAFKDNELVGFARAMFDGCDADVAVLLDIRYQGEGLRHNDGSIIEKDRFGVGRKKGELLIR
jgi:hypothetical protein